MRAICEELQMKDLPSGPRMQWINRMYRDMYRMMKSKREDPVKVMKHAWDRMMRNFIRDVVRFHKKLDQKQRAAAPKE
jgi:hypothetical protein